MSSISVNTITDASGGSTTSINGFTPSVSNMAGRNRIINGDMRIDQRNAGASVATSADFGAYTIDRFYARHVTDGALTFQQVTDAPLGFVNSLKITVTTADSSISSTQRAWVAQFIEGLNVSDLAWGTANAKNVVLSFWVKASVTGTFCCSVVNSANNRAYPVNYTINLANTWEQKTVTVAGDTSGTWLTTNGIGFRVYFPVTAGTYFQGTNATWNSSEALCTSEQTNLMATSGATFYITGVQLEEGSVATPFCPAGGGSYGAELALCQRYYYVLSAASNQNTFFSSTSGYASTQALCVIPFSNTMRTNPSLVTSGTASDYRLIMGGSFLTCSSVPTMDQPNPNSANLIFTVSSGIVVGYGGQALANNTTSAFLGFSAEL